MNTTKLMFLLTIGVLTATSSTTAFAQSSINVTATPPVITVSGNAQVEAVPDEATVRIGVVRQGGSAKEAQEDANKIGQALLKAIGALGIPPQRVQTTRLTISPVYPPQRPGNGNSANPANYDPPRIIGYLASNSVTVTLDNLALIGPVVDAGLESGTNQLENVQFQLKNDGPAREAALRQAVVEAMGKARVMADALGVTLGPVQELIEAATSIAPVGGRNDGVFAMSARTQTPTPVSVGELEIRASVVLKYTIGSK